MSDATTSAAVADNNIAAPTLPPADYMASWKNMALLIQLRWIAVVGQILTIAVVRLGFNIALPLVPMFLVLCGLIALNLGSIFWLKEHKVVTSASLFVVLVLDVSALTAQLYLSGGATNPFIFLYLLQVTLAAVLLDARLTTAIVAIACVSFAGLTVYYQPIILPGHAAEELFQLHIVGMFICFVLDAALLVVFVSRITRNLRERDAHLAALKQHAAEEDHIVRMGLLASGAAHELGTPLSSLSVILGDWRRVPSLAADPVMLQEIDEMQAEVGRCKAIVTGILLSAGEARGEAPSVTTVNAFLDELVSEWRAARSATTLSYGNAFGLNLAIVSDSALKQVIFTVLDNAFEASPNWIGFVAERDGEMLVLRISDAGPGFAPEMLAKFGKPYQSSKGKLGGGLGLFLVVNAVRKLGGAVNARNLPQGGAAVTLNLPLASLAIGARGHVQ
ncbi:ATP-binding protein [Phyllobacterium sp. 628]|uniref:ATP-binding protein n=1 Tax=Phyllobacterium sp. 628 TaxID=2718938 RepID=UPI001FCEDE64|nr:ATP-binding protein [Phyllobacterium sp. 628]